MSRQSKFLSLVLRHKPEEIGLRLDKNGWARIDELLRLMKKSGRAMSRDDLEMIVATSDKKRFTISDDGLKIRAAQGHSVDIDLGLEPSAPPEILYHGTARTSLDSIFRQGLVPGNRRQVHLSLDAETATQVGRRHGKPVVLAVEAGRMRRHGYAFFRAENGVWLTDAVPAAYLGFA